MRMIEILTESGLGGMATSNFDIPENSNRALKAGALADMRRLATGRNPKDEELQGWITFSNEILERFTADPGNAEKFLAYGEKTREKSLPPTELAALSFTKSTILNLDETITRD